MGSTGRNTVSNNLLMGPESQYRRVVSGDRLALAAAGGETIYINTRQPDGIQLNERQIRERAFAERIHQNQVSIDDTQYRFSTGRSPRGNGTWYFFRNKSQDIDGEYITASGSYADAKRRARSMAAYYGWRNLYVGT